MTDDPRVYRLQEIGLAWLIAYLATTALIVWCVFHARSEALASLDTPEARAAWEAWRRSAADQGRRVPSSHEPPMLVLMRDYFGVMLAAAIVLGSFLFAVFMIAIRGVLRRPASSARHH